MSKLEVTSASAVSEPRTTVTAATNFSGFRDDPTFGAHGTNGGRRRDWWCGYVSNGQLTKIKTRKKYRLVCMRGYLPDVSLALTFAGLGALEPSVISVSAADASTILIPSTARSATTGSA